MGCASALPWHLDLASIVQVDPQAVPVPQRIAAVQDAAVRASRHPLVRGDALAIARLYPYRPAPDPVRAYYATTRFAGFAKVPDPGTCDAVAGPLYVRRWGEGDCLNLSGLLCAELLALGYRAQLLRLDLPDNPQDHVVVEVFTSHGSQLADPTASSPALDVLNPVAKGSPTLAGRHVVFASA